MFSSSSCVDDVVALALVARHRRLQLAADVLGGVPASSGSSRGRMQHGELHAERRWKLKPRAEWHRYLTATSVHDVVRNARADDRGCVRHKKHERERAWASADSADDLGCVRHREHERSSGRVRTPDSVRDREWDGSERGWGVCVNETTLTKRSIIAQTDAPATCVVGVWTRSEGKFWGRSAERRKMAMFFLLRSKN